MRTIALLAGIAISLVGAASLSAEQSLVEAIAATQPKIVKVYGAGGVQGLEHYQSGFLISPDGHVLTVWSYVLDAEEVIVTLDDGRRFVAQLFGADPRLEVAILKIEAAELPHFSLEAAVSLQVGDRVVAYSNLFNVATGDESASVLHGIVSSTTNLAARRGVYRTPYRGSVYVLDAMTNNPGAAGGALTNRHGELAGMLGKELRNAQDSTWLNYAVPISDLRSAVSDLLARKPVTAQASDSQRKPKEPMTLELLGVVLVPDVLVKTPPFIDGVRPGSPAAKAGLKPDDLIVFLNDRMVVSSQALREELSFVDRIDEVQLVVQRGQELVHVSLFASHREGGEGGR